VKNRVSPYMKSKIPKGERKERGVSECPCHLEIAFWRIGVRYEEEEGERYHSESREGELTSSYTVCRNQQR